MAERVFECTEGKSNKFWAVSVSGSTLVTRWGKIGVKGSTTEKDLPSNSAAEQEAEKLIAQKLKKGYVETTPKSSSSSSSKRKEEDEVEPAAKRHKMAGSDSKVYMEHEGGTKFWEIELDGSSTIVRFGKIGTNGQTRPKKHKDQAAAKAFMEKTIQEKKKGGYSEKNDVVAADDEKGGSMAVDEWENAFPDSTRSEIVYYEHEENAAFKLYMKKPGEKLFHLYHGRVGGRGYLEKGDHFAVPSVLSGFKAVAFRGPKVTTFSPKATALWKQIEGTIVLENVLSFFYYNQARTIYGGVSHRWHRAAGNVKHVFVEGDDGVFQREFASCCEDEYVPEDISKKVFSGKLNFFENEHLQAIRFFNFQNLGKNEEDDLTYYRGIAEVRVPLVHVQSLLTDFNDEGKVFEIDQKKWKYEDMPKDGLSHTAWVHDRDEESVVVWVKVAFNEDNYHNFDCIEDPIVEAPLTKHQNQPVREGVAYADDALSESMVFELNQTIDAFAKSQEFVDYHPHSSNMVRDIVHPALYSFIKDVSKFHPSNDLPQVPFGNPGEEKCDHWGRKYEVSAKYQWLPTYFDVDDKGNVKIRGELNGVPRKSENMKLYGLMERMFQRFLPFVEGVASYGKVIELMKGEEDEVDEYDDYYKHIPQLLLQRSASIQVIPKIVDYELAPGATYEGVWHVEGMSHEHILCTCLAILDRDECISGGDLLFKRGYTVEEAGNMVFSLPQCRDPYYDTLINNAMVPLGRCATPNGRMICFPNSHVHKVTKMQNLGDRIAKRRILVFFVVDPDHRIVSTQEVLPSEQRENIPLEDALEHRLKLMHERKHHKQDWNIREISLCEH